VTLADGKPAEGFVVFDAIVGTGGLQELGRVPLKDGKASVTVPLSTETKYTIKANFDGWGDVTASHDEQEHEVVIPPDADIVASINQKVKNNDNLDSEITRLNKLDMRTLLNVLDQLNKAGTLEKMTVELPDRVTVAALTVEQRFGSDWRSRLDALSADDRAAIRARTPADVIQEVGLDKPKKPGDEEDRPIVVGLEGVEMEAKLTFKSKEIGSLGETEFTVHVGPDGKLKQFEIGVTAIKKSVENWSKLGPILDLEATLSLNATLDNQAVTVDPKDGKVVFDAIQVQAKGEIEVHFKTIPVLKKVVFKLSGTIGTGGAGFELTVEIPLPKALQ
jgi:hypothetical protein